MNSDQEIKQIVPSNQDIKNHWNAFYKIYIDNCEQSFLPFYFNLLSLINIDKAISTDKILELSIGAGLGFYHLINTTDAELYGGDFSDKMLEEAQKRVDSYGDRIKNRKIQISYLNNEDLSIYNDNTFRSVFSNLSLHSVENPLKMLKECYRVLDKTRKDSKCAFSLWGRPENTFFHTVIPNALKKNGIELPNKRTGFHLSEIEKTKALFFEAGFSNVHCAYTNVVFNITKFEDFEFILGSPHLTKVLENCDKETENNIIKTIKEDFEEEMKIKGSITKEVLIVHAN